MSDITVRAKLKLLTTEQGGRMTPIRSRYRPNHVFKYKNNEIKETCIGEVVFEEPSEIKPGEEALVTVNFLRLGNVEKYMEVGRKWWIHEGTRLVGKAEIIEI